MVERQGFILEGDDYHVFSTYVVYSCMYDYMAIFYYSIYWCGCSRINIIEISVTKMRL